MSGFKLVYTDNGFPTVEVERKICEDAGGDLSVCQCTTEDEVIRDAAGADGLLVQWAPITRRVIESLDRCKVIVRIGIGVDNVDMEAATDCGIAVCNVPDYCVDEVADHTIALALTMARQIPQIQNRMRRGEWSIMPPQKMPAFKEMTFGTLGYGRIAQGVLSRATGFGFRLITHDPYATISDPSENGVTAVALEQLLRMSDILSLHCPLTENTHHIINSSTIMMMKPTALLVNTSRGGLVDLDALADCLRKNSIAGAGLDVYDPEPLDPAHPIRNCDNAVLTSHVSWYSESSVPTLQRKAAEEAVRGALGQDLVSKLN